MTALLVLLPALIVTVALLLAVWIDSGDSRTYVIPSDEPTSDPLSVAARKELNDMCESMIKRKDVTP